MRFSLIFCIVILASCRKKEAFDPIRVIGHACNGLELKSSVYHDNTYEAANLALSTEACNGIEVDVQLSLDGTLWLYHDTELSTETNGTSCLATKTDSEIRELNYKTIHKEKLCTLDQLVDLIPENGIILLDLRHYNECTNQIVDLIKFNQSLKKWQNSCQKIIEIWTLTNNENWIELLKKDGFKVLFSSESMEKTNFIKTNYSCDGFVMKNSAISKEDVTMLKADNKKVAIFEVRSPKGIRKALKKLPDMLVTDDIRATIIEKY